MTDGYNERHEREYVGENEEGRRLSLLYATRPVPYTRNERERIQLYRELKMGLYKTQ